MSVYIKGMEMPKGRPVCIVIDAAGQARRYDLNNDRYADDKLFEAVPVSTHGRLIDADALKKSAYPFPCAIGTEWAVTLRQINDAPAIIPASGGKEDE